MDGAVAWAARAVGAADPGPAAAALVATCTGLVLAELSAQDGRTEERLREVLTAQLRALAPTRQRPRAHRGRSPA